MTKALLSGFDQSLLYEAFQYAAKDGNAEAIKALLSDGREVDQSLLYKAFQYAAEKGHAEVIKALLSDRREVDQSLLYKAFQYLAEKGHAEVIKALLSGGRQVGQPLLNEFFKNAAEKGHAEVIKALLSGGRQVGQSIFEGAFTKAVKDGNEDVIKALLSGGRQVDRSLLNAAKNGDVDIVKAVLSGGRQVHQNFLEDAFKEAAKNGHAEVIKALLSGRGQVSDFLLEVIIEYAAQKGDVEIIKAMLSDNRTYPQRCLDKAIRIAAEKGDVEVIEALLSGEWTSSQQVLDQLVRNTVREFVKLTGKGDNPTEEGKLVKFLELVLKNGTISPHIKREASILVSDSDSKEVRDIIGAVKTKEIPNSQPDKMVVEHKKIKQKCEEYLSYISEFGMPESVEFVEYSEAVDLGGPKKEFITALCEALADTGGSNVLSLRAYDQLPKYEEGKEYEEGKDLSIFKQMGTFISFLHESNASPSDKILAGNVFNPAFFELVKLASTITDEGVLIKEAAKVLVDVDDLFWGSARFIIAPENNSVDEGTLGDIRSEILSFLAPAREFASGMNGKLKQELSSPNADANAIALSIQGETVTKESLIEALTIKLNPFSSYVASPKLEEKLNFIKEKIESADEEWLKKFLKTITGRSTTAPGMKIEIRDYGDPFEIHTCFNSLGLPTSVQQMEKENFLAALNAIIEKNDGYNIA